MSSVVANGLHGLGYSDFEIISATLQGHIIKARYKNRAEPVIIKIANQYLHHHSFAVVDGQRYAHVQEDIVSEGEILRYLSLQSDAPQSIVKYLSRFKCEKNYYLVMEHGGITLFDFVKQCHTMIDDGWLDVAEWHEVVKLIFVQMIDCLQYLHSKRICHFDVSLENWLISDVGVQRTESPVHVSFINKDMIKIKLIDFGLAAVFDEKNVGFESDKFCGKTAYKSREVEARQRFNAKKNDIWCLGVCLFMMAFGSAPWRRASETDELFVIIMGGRMMDLLVSWDKQKVNEEVVDLLQCIFRFEEERSGAEAIKMHPWLRLKLV